MAEPKIDKAIIDAIALIQNAVKDHKLNYDVTNYITGNGWLEKGKPVENIKVTIHLTKTLE